MINQTRPRIVLDSVILVSAFLAQEGLTAELLKLCAEHTNPYTAEEILQETRSVLLVKKHLRKKYVYNDDQVERFIEHLRTLCTIVLSLPEIQVIAKDPKDDKILACAVAAKADYLVSRDPHLLDLQTCQGVKILTPEECITFLRERP